MVDLRRHQQPILQFFETGLRRFRESFPTASVRHVALYCCPWSGWVSLCVDSVPQADQNCPDFEHVEIALYEATDWSSEYESEEYPRIRRLDGEVIEVDLDSGGDEAFNHVFFQFLSAVLALPETLKLLEALADKQVHVGVQMLDSGLNHSWLPDAV